MKYIIAIDPGNNTGITHGIGQNPITELHDFTPKAATKKRLAEEKHLRYGKLWYILNHIVENAKRHQDCNILIICEGAAGFTKGKAAVEVSNKYRGVVEAFAAISGSAYMPIQPNDLQRWASGKGRAEKTEMVKIAMEKYGYRGTNDNESDSLLLFHFAKEFLKEQVFLSSLAMKSLDLEDWRSTTEKILSTSK